MEVAEIVGLLKKKNSIYNWQNENLTVLENQLFINTK